MKNLKDIIKDSGYITDNNNDDASAAILEDAAC